LKTKKLGPVVFVAHDGTSKYLSSVISAATSSFHKVYYIGDQDIPKKLLFKNQIIRPNFSKTLFLDKFTKVWKHQSIDEIKWSFGCFARHFFVLEAANRLKLSDFWIIDSDFLVLKNLSTVTEYLKQKKFEGVLSSPKSTDQYFMASSPHCSYWNIHSLKEFIIFTINQYKNNSTILMKKYAHHKAIGLPGGVCDMTLLYLWKNHTKRKICNSVELINSGLLIDHNINFPCDFYELGDFHYNKEKKITEKNKFNILMENYLGIKKVRKKKLFYATKADGSEVKVIGLHFQGKGKIFIKRFMFWESTCYFFYIDIILIKFVKKIIKSMLCSKLN
jgi:hypothetical protein